MGAVQLLRRRLILIKDDLADVLAQRLHMSLELIRIIDLLEVSSLDFK